MGWVLGQLLACAHEPAAWRSVPGFDKYGFDMNLSWPRMSRSEERNP